MKIRTLATIGTLSFTMFLSAAEAGKCDNKVGLYHYDRSIQGLVVITGSNNCIKKEVSSDGTVMCYSNKGCPPGEANNKLIITPQPNQWKGLTGSITLYLTNDKKATTVARKEETGNMCVIPYISGSPQVYMVRKCR